MKRILCAICVSLLSWQALGGEVEDNFKKFDVAVHQALANKKGTPRNTQSDIENLRDRIARDELEMAIEILQGANWTHAELYGSTLDEALAQTRSDLLASLQKEQQKRDKAEIAPIEAAIAHATAAIKKAKTAADLDTTIDELAKIIEDPSAGRNLSPSLKEKYQKAENARDFVCFYQEYLAAKAGGYEDRAREIAQSLAQNSDRLLPRSELLLKAYEPKPAEVPKDQLPKPEGK